MFKMGVYNFKLSEYTYYELSKKYIESGHSFFVRNMILVPSVRFDMS